MKRTVIALGAAVSMAACSSTQSPPDDAAAPDVVLPDRPPVPVDVSPVDASPVDVSPVDVSPVDASPGGTFCARTPENVPAGITVPPEFCIRRFARIGHPRVLAFSPTGDLFVASPSAVGPGGTGPGEGAIVVLADDNRDGLGDAPRQFLQNVATVHGLLFDPDALIYTLENGVFRVPFMPGDRVARTPVAQHQRLAQLNDSVRWTHTVARGTDGALYVTMGQHETAQCPPPNRRAGSVLRIGAGMPLEGTRVIDGLRNPMYMRCKEWGACYAAELSGDSWTSFGGVEKLVQLRQGDDYGYPCCIDRNVVWPGTPRGYDCGTVAVSVQTYPLHDTPFGFDWAPSSWPAPYGSAFFVGLHGVVGSWLNTGVQWAPTDPVTHRPTRSTTFFVSGWGRNGPIRGRVADLTFAPDGRMFFSDDQDGAIYWIAPRTLRVPAR